MSHSNNLVAFLRHYGPIPASDNMYDELIQTEIEHYGIEKPINIPPARLPEVIENFEAEEPKNVILTGTAGDGKTYHCRRVWEHFGGDPERWRDGTKAAELRLPASGKHLIIVKDLSELTVAEKQRILPELADAVRGENTRNIYLVAANDGQLLASWRDFAEASGGEYYRDFKSIEGMLVDEKTTNKNLSLLLYNLSHLDGSEHFEEILTEVTEHPQWRQCEGCTLLSEDGSTKCPIRINRDRLRGTDDGVSPFRHRMSELLKLARANRMHLPIRDLLLLCVNIILGDHESRSLLTCRKAMNRAESEAYRETNPYANAFGANLRPRQRQQYQAFSTLEAFGIGRETDNKIDNLLVYGPYDDEKNYQALIGNDPFYGGIAYRNYLRDYLEGERENMGEFMRALALQRQRLFFSLPLDSDLSPWSLSVYQSSGTFLEFGKRLAAGDDASRIAEILVRGLNRTFCGMMIDEGDRLYLASSGGDGRGRIASILNFDIGVSRHRRDPYLDFGLAHDGLTPRMMIVDPAADADSVIDELELQITHFEYLMRVAKGSLPASFSRQCYEDFLDFKLRVIKHLVPIIGDEPRPNEISVQAVKVDERGRPQPDNIRIRVGGI
ncbi:hypothetical protein [Ruegeria sp. HKCCSP346]|uniref:hypothetical protein n=1 Tax=Ruegeria sp. HKCCSP346 TaxID=2794830 RepID=UPI001AEA6585|nr:hypothetical protein [Ruegeria sp. HKCCSP346]